MARLITTVFYVGRLRPAPGTWGSLAALPLALLIYMAAGWVGLAIAIVAACGIGHWAITQETARTGEHDASEIVIDEVAGQWLALMPVAYGAHFSGAAITALWPGWVVAFLAFRLFDITKPWLVGRADRKHSAWGVIEDDLWAGLFAAIVVIVIGILAHVVFL